MRIFPEFLNKKISTPIGIIVILFFTLLAGGFLFWQCQIMPRYEIPLIKFPLRPGNQVTITTDKTEYEAEDTVKIAVKNNLDKSVWYKSYDPSSCVPNLELLGYKEENWSPIPLLPFIPPKECNLEIKELKKDGVVILEYKPLNWIHPDFLNFIKYKLSFEYRENKEEGEYKTIYSNEFRIREKPVSQKDLRCLMPKPAEIGLCEILKGFYYDASLNECKPIGGCEIEGEVPFNADQEQECTRLCVEKEIPEEEKLFIIESNPSLEEDDIAASVAIDLNYIYIVGTDRVLGESKWRWRIEKRSKLTGALVPEFGKEGVVTSVNGALSSIDIDSNYIYIAGYDFPQKGPQEWRIEKRDKISGALVTEFGTAGVITYSTGIYNESADLIRVDSNFIYVIGSEFFDWDVYQWRIEKRDKTTGDLITEFGTKGAINSTPTWTPESDSIDDIYIDSHDMYLVVREILVGSTITCAVEKRSRTTGALVKEFGEEGRIVISSPPGNKWANSITVDSNYIYLVGYDNGISSTDTQWRIEKRDKKIGRLVNEFGKTGIINSNPSGHDESAFSVAVDPDYLYVVGEDSTPPYDGRDSRWRLEKRNKVTGEPVSKFGEEGAVISKGTEGGTGPSIKIDSNYIYLGGSVRFFHGLCWRIEKRDKTTGSFAFKPKEVFREETIDWETYKNEECGFEIKYPSKWKVKKDWLFSGWGEVSFLSDPSSGVVFSIEINTYKDYSRHEFVSQGKDVILEGVKVYPTIYYNPLYYENLICFGICFDKNLKYAEGQCPGPLGRFYYQFSLYCGRESSEEKMEINECNRLFNQIVSTFKFIED